MCRLHVSQATGAGARDKDEDFYWPIEPILQIAARICRVRVTP